MFLVDYDGSLIDVPIKVKNLLGNEGPEEKDWVLTRRFMVFDTVSGIAGDNALQNLGNINDNGLPNKQIEMVRYAKNMTLNIMLDTDPAKPEAIFVPYLEISYEEKKTEEILEDETERHKHVFFISEYTMDTTGFWKMAKIVFWIVFALMMVLWLLSTYMLTSSTSINTDN